jgi:hypothetical protein
LENLEFEVSLGYTGDPVSKEQKEDSSEKKASSNQL